MNAADLKTLDLAALNLADLPMHDLRGLWDDEATARTQNAAATLPDEHPKTHTSRNRRRTIDDTLYASRAREQIGHLPRPGHALHMLLAGSFDAWDMVPAVLDLAADRCHHLTVATLNFNLRAARALFDLLDSGRIGATTFLVSHLFRSQERDAYAYLHDGLARRGSSVAIARSHAKILVWDFGRGHQYAAEGSANLRACKNLEQLTLYHDPRLATWHAGWIHTLVARAAGKSEPLPCPDAPENRRR